MDYDCARWETQRLYATFKEEETMTITNKKIVTLLVMIVSCASTYAQLTLNIGKDSQLRKLQIAEIAINNYYVDSVDESKLVEDAIKGML